MNSPPAGRLSPALSWRRLPISLQPRSERSPDRGESQGVWGVSPSEIIFRNAAAIWAVSIFRHIKHRGGSKLLAGRRLSRQEHPSRTSSTSHCQNGQSRADGDRVERRPSVVIRQRASPHDADGAACHYMAPLDIPAAIAKAAGPAQAAITALRRYSASIKTPRRRRTGVPLCRPSRHSGRRCQGGRSRADGDRVVRRPSVVIQQQTRPHDAEGAACHCIAPLDVPKHSLRDSKTGETFDNLIESRRQSHRREIVIIYFLQLLEYSPDLVCGFHGRVGFLDHIAPQT